MTREDAIRELNRLPLDLKDYSVGRIKEIVDALNMAESVLRGPSKDVLYTISDALKRRLEDSEKDGVVHIPKDNIETIIMALERNADAE